MLNSAACVALLLATVALSLAQEAYQPTIPTSNVCGRCCQQGTYCEPTSTDTTLARAAGGLDAGFLIPAGSSMTCFLRDREQAGAVDGGLCIPSTGIPDQNNFCSDLSGSPTAKVVPTRYEAGLEEQEGACQPCCDGQYVCGFGLKCARVVESGGGVCVPEDDYSANFCRGFTLGTATLSCERCDAYTPLARHVMSNARSSSSRRSMAEGLFGGGGGVGASGGGSTASSGSAGQSATPTRTAPVATPAATPAPTAAATPTRTVAATPTPTRASTPTPTVAATPAPTIAATATPTVAATPTPTVAATPAATAATYPYPTAAASPIPTTAATPYPTPAATPYPTPAATQSFANQDYRRPPNQTPTPTYQNPFPPNGNNRPPYNNNPVPPNGNNRPPWQNPPYQNPYPPNKPPGGGYPPQAPAPRLG